MEQTLFTVLYHVHCNYSKIPSNIGHRNSRVDQVRKRDADFSFYFVLYLHRLSSKLKHLSHKSEGSTKHLLIHCGIGKNNGLIFPTLPRKTHIQQYYTEGLIGHRCGAETSWEEGRDLETRTNAELIRLIGI